MARSADVVEIVNKETNKYDGDIGGAASTVIIVPETAGDGFTIGGKFGWDPGLYIEWVYKLKE